MAVCSDSRVFVVLMICLVSSLCLLWYFHFRDSDLARIEKLFSRVEEQLVRNSSTPLSKAEGFIAEGVDWTGEFVWGFQVRV